MSSRVSTYLAVACLLTLLGVILWREYAGSDEVVEEDRLSVVTTIYPLADFAKQIGGEYITVTNVIPPGAEPHDYEPSPRDVAKVLEADVLIYLGGGLDAWAEDLAEEVRENGGQVVGIEDEVTFASVHSELDPHIWLDPVESQSVVFTIRDAMIAVDFDHEQVYRDNAQIYTHKLKELATAYAVGLSGCELNDIIVSHDAFGYLARRYSFTIHPIAGISPEAEPSIRDLTRLAKEVEDLGIKTIFFETLVSPKLAETLATEVGATTAVLDPLEGLSQEDIAKGEDYLSVMTKNLQALRTAMVCQ